MIQANELRVGCNFLAGKELVQVFTIAYDRNEGYLINTSIPLDCLSGIPLTEDILLKAGFEMKQHHLESYKDYRLGNMVCTFISAGMEVEFCGLDIEERTYIGLYHNIHQLQNLYFALTGKELNINLIK